MTTPRKVRPGEVPRFGSVWRWADSDYLVLGTVAKSTHRGDQRNLVALTLGPHPALNNSMIWSMPAHVGMGPVVSGWVCVEEAP